MPQSSMRAPCAADCSTQNPSRTCNPSSTSVPEMANQKNWRPLDGRETNFNVTSNQASDGGKALTELMTNMVDAVLMKHALQKGINPKGRTLPPPCI